MVKAAAATTERRQGGEDQPAPVDVIARKLAAPGAAAVEKEVKKGYDLLLVGIRNIRAKGGGFHPDVERIASAFDGPLAIATAKGTHLQQPKRSPSHILVPVNGTEVSRRAAEIAVAIARACDCPIMALYVAGGAASSPRRRRGFRARREQQAIMKDFVEMADRYDARAKTTVQAEAAPDKAILAELRRAEYDLIIMGVSRRPGDKLFFGDTAAAVLENATVSLVLVAS
jgi:nucleotide-binding universal stress UspA family protein